MVFSQVIINLVGHFGIGPKTLVEFIVQISLAHILILQECGSDK